MGRLQEEDLIAHGKFEQRRTALFPLGKRETRRLLPVFKCRYVEGQYFEKIMEGPAVNEHTAGAAGACAVLVATSRLQRSTRDVFKVSSPQSATCLGHRSRSAGGEPRSSTASQSTQHDSKILSGSVGNEDLARRVYLRQSSALDDENLMRIWPSGRSWASVTG